MRATNSACMSKEISAKIDPLLICPRRPMLAILCYLKIGKRFIYFLFSFFFLNCCFICIYSDPAEFQKQPHPAPPITRNPFGASPDSMNEVCSTSREKTFRLFVFAFSIYIDHYYSLCMLGCAKLFVETCWLH